MFLYWMGWDGMGWMDNWSASEDWIWENGIFVYYLTAWKWILISHRLAENKACLLVVWR